MLGQLRISTISPETWLQREFYSALCEAQSMDPHFARCTFPDWAKDRCVLSDFDPSRKSAQSIGSRNSPNAKRTRRTSAALGKGVKKAGQCRLKFKTKAPPIGLEPMTRRLIRRRRTCSAKLSVDPFSADSGFQPLFSLHSF